MHIYSNICILIFTYADYLPPIRIHQPRRIIPTIRVRTHSGVLVRHRVHAEPDGEGGMVVPRRCPCDGDSMEGGKYVGEGGHGGEGVGLLICFLWD